MTLLEIYDRIDSYRRTSEVKQKERIERLFTLADAVSTRIIYFFEDPKDRREEQILQPWDAYPGLFTNEENKAQETKKDLELERYKAARVKYAQAVHQKLMRQNNGN